MRRRILSGMKFGAICPQSMRTSSLIFAFLAGLIFLPDIVYGQAFSPIDSSSQALMIDAKEYDQPVDPELFLVRPAEKLTVTFIGSKIASIELTVDPEGRVIHSSTGIIQLSGLTLSQARGKLIPVLTKLYTAESIEISISSPRQVSIHVAGAVARPGLYRAYLSQHVSEVVALAGGVTEAGSRRQIEFRGGAKPLNVDIDRAEYLADASADPYVYAGSSLWVPAKSNNVISIVGEVTNPRSIELLTGDNLATLISLAGGVTQFGDIDKVRMLNGDGSLQAGTIVVVPPSTESSISKGIQVFGAVQTPGRFPLPTPSTLGAALQYADNLSASANSGRVTVFRRLPPDEWGATSSKRYAVVAADGSGKADANFPVQDGDSVFVPARTTIVTVEGVIALPGVYLYSEGKTAGYYIALAGGIIDSSEKFDISIYDRITGITTRQSSGAIVRDGDKIVVSSVQDSK
jgi:protein involved in polysaccharide export with SLBB domain